MCKACAPALVAWLPFLANAQAVAPDPDAIIVTATRHKEMLNDVPLAVAAVPGEALVRHGIARLDQLAAAVPGFTYQSTSFDTPVFAIRGIGFYDYSIGSTPTVGLYLDEAPIPYAQEARGLLLDLDRLEVLKGPQGSLFGQGTTGGVVNAIPARPTDTPAAGARIGFGRFAAIEAEAFLSGPIAPGLKARVAVRREYRGDWQHPWLPNDARFGQQSGAGTGARRFTTARAVIDWRPVDRLAVTATLHGWRDGSDLPAFHYAAFAPNTAENALNTRTYAALATLAPMPHDARLAGWDAGADLARHDRFALASLRATLTLTKDVELIAIGAVSRYRERSRTDLDGTAYADLFSSRIGHIDSLSQELRLSGGTGPLRWTLGGLYARDRTREEQHNLSGGGTSNAVGPFLVSGVVQRSRQTISTRAAFASADLPLLAAVALHGSLRYTRQDRDFAGCLADDGDGSLATAIAAVFGVAATPGGCVTQTSPGVLPPIVDGRLDQHNLSFRTSVDWKPRPDALLYVAVAKGYKPGSFAVVPALFAAQFDPVTQESVLAAEGGARFGLFGRRLRLDLSAFHYAYRNKQLMGTVLLPPFGPLPQLVNIPRSTVDGAEASLVLRPGSRFTLSGGITYVASRVDRDPPMPVDAYGVPTSFIGDSFPNTPRWQGVAEALWRRPLGRVALVLAADVTARSGTYGIFGANPELRMPGYALLDLRAALEAPDGRWRAELWGRNVANRFYYLSLAHNGDAIVGQPGMPATWGITLEWRR
ncbi:TonB-dependent receptor [Flavisphingomonas formosensis]|uniref:TonB-dependent receptor n=1 Tax=Flavisphingomonas formosensis TaxID=861534 RepID=UPI0018DFB57E|nr:TonB-dependent receptor [Sphingomonas formosensis]